MGLTNCLINHCLLIGGHARLERHAAECPKSFKFRLVVLVRHVSSFLGF